MVACSFDMQFMFAHAGREGTTHDIRVLLFALNNPVLNFLKPNDTNDSHSNNDGASEKENLRNQTIASLMSQE